MQPADSEAPSEDPSEHQLGADAADSSPDWERRRRLAEVFGDVLPDTTSDERDPGEGARSVGRGLRDETRGDTWLRDQVPPHHGG